MRVLDLTGEYKPQEGEVVISGNPLLFNEDDREFGKVILPLHVKGKFGENEKYEYPKPKRGKK